MANSPINQSTYIVGSQKGIQPDDVGFLLVFEAVGCYYIFDCKSRSGLRVSQQGLIYWQANQLDAL
jgi:hypothetical protein